MSFLIIFGAKYLYLVIGLIAAIVFLISTNSVKKMLLVLSALVLPLSYLLAKILGFFIQSPRPFVVDHLKPLINASTDNGFPSDHTLLSMSIALVIVTYNKKVGGILILLALCVGVSRVLANVHHPSDIIGSIFIAVLAISISMYSLKRFKKIEYLLDLLLKKLWLLKT